MAFLPLRCPLQASLSATWLLRQPLPPSPGTCPTCLPISIPHLLQFPLLLSPFLLSCIGKLILVPLHMWIFCILQTLRDSGQHNFSIKHLTCSYFRKFHKFPQIDSFVWSPPCPGSPSLLYNLTVVSHHGSVQPRFFADGYLDGQPFLHYDSEKGRAEPRGLWAGAVLGAETWNTETKDLEKKVKDLKMTLADIMALQDQKGDSHSLQEIRGCEIQEDNSARGLWHFCYDGELFLSYNPKTNEWTVAKSSAQTQAVEIKKSWEADGFQSKDYHARVQGELCGRLRRYQKSWMGFMDHTASPRGSKRVNLNPTHPPASLEEFGLRVKDRLGKVLVPPSVNVTCSQASDGMVTLTCWAFGFSPRNISVTWLQDEEPLSQDAQQSRGVLPDGNGTYQTWVAIRIPQGEEQRFMCHVEHSGNHTVHPVTSGKAVVQQFEWPVILALALGGSSSVFIAVTVCVLCYKKKKKTTPAAESTGEKTGQ
ncbi:MHC class I polypeptide-related sequence B-like isoform X2 [Equus przewalskii]|uniref:MHC class I polypeptide-related sequence B-like isoform X2 n=1 Tax=Equus przewalskii TaxID=9798 RepID=A0ABM4LMT8_EQUPR